MLQYFRKLSIGVKRLVITGTLFVPPIIGVLFGIGYSTYETILLSYMFITPIYWIGVLLGSWVYDGFKKNN